MGELGPKTLQSQPDPDAFSEDRQTERRLGSSSTIGCIRGLHGVGVDFVGPDTEPMVELCARGY